MPSGSARHGSARWTRWLLVPLGAAVLGPVIWLASIPDPLTRLEEAREPARLVTDRHGALLRFVPARSGERYLPMAADRLPPQLVAAVLAAEDRRFFRHRGVDPLALARAAWQNAAARRVVSGGSTITMQLARLLDPRPRTLAGKLVQIVQAWRLESCLGKREILAAYCSRVPMGNRLVGFEAAALAYLGKPAAQLSPAEAALLAAVPRAPSRRNPFRRAEELLRARDRILRRMHRAGWLDDTALLAALGERTVLADRPFRRLAPHFVARALAEARVVAPQATHLTTTLDGELQHRVEVMVRRHLDRLAEAGVNHMAVVVLDVERGEWLALEGSGGFATAPAGQLDGTRVPRQPGSTLKPFTYAAAFDRSFTPATILADLPRAYPWREGTWVPRNYDERYHGPLRARQALACSVNVPAAAVLAAITPETLLATLRAAGITTLHESASYGLGLTLGAGEVRLDELTAAFAALLRGGEWREPSSLRALHTGDGARAGPHPRRENRRICSPQAAAQVVDILADPEARAPAFGEWSVLRLPFAAAVKTGTSEGFRDNWCVGGTREVAVGVWCGNFDRSPMGNVSGVSGAGSVWREVMLAWASLAHGEETLAGRATLRPPPADLRRVRVCALSGKAATPVCPASVEELLRPADAALPPCDWHARTADGRTVVRWPAAYRAWAAAAGLVREEAAAPVAAFAPPELTILSPADGDVFLVSPELPRQFQRLELRCAASHVEGEVVWLVDGVEVERSASPYTVRWPLTPGVHRIEATSGDLRSRPVRVTVYGS